MPPGVAMVFWRGVMAPASSCAWRSFACARAAAKPLSSSARARSDAAASRRRCAFDAFSCCSRSE
jgi:hypothetical protein